MHDGRVAPQLEAPFSILHTARCLESPRARAHQKILQGKTMAQCRRHLSASTAEGRTVAVMSGRMYDRQGLLTLRLAIACWRSRSCSPKPSESGRRHALCRLRRVPPAPHSLDPKPEAKTSPHLQAESRSLATKWDSSTIAMDLTLTVSTSQVGAREP